MRRPKQVYKSIPLTHRLVAVGIIIAAIEVAILVISTIKISQSDFSLSPREFMLATATCLLFVISNLIFIIRIIYHETQLEYSKKVFVSLASHELRTPATAVKNILSILEEGYAGELSSEQREYIAMAIKSNERQLRVIETLLYTAQLENKDVDLRREKLDLAEIINFAIEPHKTAIDARQQKLRVSLEDKLFIIADEVCMLIAIDHLISNATKYTPEGGIISVSAEKSFNRAIITITDTGVSVQERDLDKLFRKFSRLDNPVSTKVGGTGLGLYITRRIVELHYGKINAKLNPHIGIQFRISLPLAPDDQGSPVL